MQTFVSYRRSDFGGQADHVVGRLHDALEKTFGAGSAYWDSEIPHAADFPRVIEREIVQAGAVILLIGPAWLDEFQRRKGSDEDHVIYEIETALAQQVPVVPVLGEGCDMLKAGDLPPSISAIANLNAVVIRNGRGFQQSLEELLAVLRRLGQFNVIAQGRFEARSELDAAGSALCFRISESGRTLSYRDVLDYWEKNDEFVDFYLSLFRKSGFDSYVWETPPVTMRNCREDFEFVLLNTPISSGRPDLETYRQYYEPENADDGVVVFDNLGGDAKLVVPSPLRQHANYSNLAHFFRDAPIAQQRALWRVVARTAKEQLEDAPIWISVAGGGIQWPHVRLDEIPKYYRHAPYSSRH